MAQTVKEYMNCLEAEIVLILPYAFKLLSFLTLNSVSLWNKEKEGMIFQEKEIKEYMYFRCMESPFPSKL